MAHLDAIALRWTEQARLLLSPREAAGAELLGLIPEYLGAFADDGAGASPRGHAGVLERHVATRMRQGYRLDEVIEEVSILRWCVATIWSETPALERPDARELERLLDELRWVCGVVVEAFARHSRDEERAEGRYLRRLQALAGEASRDDDGGAPPVLPEIVALVMEAMGAQTAALLLPGPAPGCLATAASAGVARGALAAYATTLGSPSFAAAIASRALEPTAVVDVFSTELEVCDALRASGIHALLGVRLPGRGALRGVLLVGVPERRAFAPREHRRIEALGEPLARHLEDAARRAEAARRERLVAALAHDLRGQLDTARLGAHLLGRAPERLGAHRKVPALIGRSVERADRAVRDLLDALVAPAARPLPRLVATSAVATHVGASSPSVAWSETS